MTMDFVTLLPVIMFATLALLLFSGFPVAFVLGGVGLGFGFIGMAFDVFSFIEFFNIISRIWGGVCEFNFSSCSNVYIYGNYAGKKRRCK